jgi:hypothetical protein
MTRVENYVLKFVLDGMQLLDDVLVPVVEPDQRHH